LLTHGFRKQQWRVDTTHVCDSDIDHRDPFMLSVSQQYAAACSAHGVTF
jgi:hypothetical protein